jgi:hypothetical protein
MGSGRTDMKGSIFLRKRKDPGRGSLRGCHADRNSAVNGTGLFAPSACTVPIRLSNPSSRVLPANYQNFRNDGVEGLFQERHLTGMSLADTFRDNAADCAFLAQRAEDEETRLTFMRMEAAWRTLANQQDRLDDRKRMKPTD